MRSTLIGVTMAVALVLGACTTAQNQGEFDTVQQRIFAVQSDYNTLLSTALTYESLPRCPEQGSTSEPCSEPAVVAAVRTAETKAYTAIQTAQELARTGTVSTETLRKAIDTAQSSVGTFENVLSERGIL